MPTILERFHATHEKSAQLYAAGREVVAGGAAQSRVMFPHPFYVDRGKGAIKWDVDGNELIDYLVGFGSLILGNARPEVTEAAERQLRNGTHFGTTSSYEVRWAELITELMPAGERVRFTASGTEAVETAVALAQVYTGSIELIALRHGYSGRSLLAQSLTAHAPWRAIPSQVAGIKHAHAPYCYRCPLKLEYPSCGIACATDIKELIRTTTTGKIAGFLAEPILGVGGFIVPPPEYFQIATDIVREHGGIFICDEVQTGFGRTGGKMFGIEHWGVEPDVMTMAKGVANGMPLGVTIATPEVADAFEALTISTFGGNPVSSTAANATIQLIESEHLADNAEAMGARLLQGMEALQRKHPKHLGDVRGKGLMLAIEFVADEPAGDRTPSPELANTVFEAAKERGLLIGKGGLDVNVLRISPALTVTTDEVDQALSILAESCAQLPT